MRLTSFTDFALRALMRLAGEPDRSFATSEIAAEFGISRNHLAKVVREDGHVRLVFKDWPIFGGVSIYAARITLASRYQDKFAEVHEALISLKEKLSEAKVDAALSAAGIDLARAKADLAAKRTEIDAVLARNHEQATGLGFQGTPAFIIGHFRVPGAPNAQAFKQAIADARAAATK